MALELGAESVEVQSDAKVIVSHIRGEFEAKGKKMKLYLSKVQDIQSSFQKFCIIKIPMEDNEKANRTRPSHSDFDTSLYIRPGLEVGYNRGGLRLKERNHQLSGKWNYAIRKEVSSLAGDESWKIHNGKLDPL